MTTRKVQAVKMWGGTKSRRNLRGSRGVGGGYEDVWADGEGITRICHFGTLCELEET
jgi:hypothetical protein